MNNKEFFDILYQTKKKHYVTSIKKTYPNIWDEVVEYNKTYNFNNISGKQMLYNWRYDIKEWPKCEVCGKPVLFGSQCNFEYSICCSKKCFGKSKTRIKEYEETCKKKYGAKNAFAADAIKTKIKKTNLKKYGVPYTMQSKAVKEKAYETNLKKYGVKNPTQSEIIKEKTKKTCLKKYGVERACQAQSVKEKIKKTNIKKYGVPCALMCPDIIQKITKTRKETCLKKYGVTYSPILIEKLKLATEKKHLEFISTIPEKFPEYVLLDKTWNKKYSEHTWKCKICGETFKRKGFPRCLNCHPLNTSIEQEELFNEIKKLCPDATQNYREALLSKKEIDIFIPSKKIGIEYNGLYWHSEEQGKTKFYHKDKTDDANKNGIRLIQIFSDEWTDPNKKKILEWKFYYLLHKMPFNSIYARKCYVKPISHKIAKQFHDKYHIQGGDKAKYNIGLFFNRFLVAVGSFQPTGISGSVILSRYSTIFSRRIVGGMSKIIKQFLRDNKDIVKITTFADLRYSNGESYEKIGFKKIKYDGPYYWYTRDFKLRIHRFNLRKTRLKMWDVEYDSSWTEKQLAAANGYVRVWDCGQIKYEFTRP